MFLVEQAWWFYEVSTRVGGAAVLQGSTAGGVLSVCSGLVVVQDFVREKPETQHLRSFTLKEFVGLLFERCPGLEPFKPSLEEIYQNFNQYKRAVPVRCAFPPQPHPASSVAACALFQSSVQVQ
jgi:hypothetical protein